MKTAMQELRGKLQLIVDGLKDATPCTDPYGYRSAMQNVILYIDVQYLEKERNQIKDAILQLKKSITTDVYVLPAVDNGKIGLDIKDLVRYGFLEKKEGAFPADLDIMAENYYSGTFKP